MVEFIFFLLAIVVVLAVLTVIAEYEGPRRDSRRRNKQLKKRREASWK